MIIVNYRDERDATIREILKYVYEHRDLPENAYDFDSADIVKECVDSGYLANVKAVQTMDGRVRLTARRPYVTTAGLAFLCPEPNKHTDAVDNNASVERIAAELKRMNDDMCQNHSEEESEKNKDRRFELLNTAFGAILGAILTIFVEHSSEIIEFFINLFQRITSTFFGNYG